MFYSYSLQFGHGFQLDAAVRVSRISFLVCILCVEHSHGSTRSFILLYRSGSLPNESLPVRFLFLFDRSCSSGLMVLTFPAILDNTYQNLFHLTIPLRIPDTKQLTLWRLLGLVENQAKLTEDLSNGLSCEKTEEELKRNLYYRLTVDELREMKMKLPQIYMSLECKQRVGEIIVATRQHPQTASYSPASSLLLHFSVVCLSALLDGKTFVLPHHIE